MTTDEQIERLTAQIARLLERVDTLEKREESGFEAAVERTMRGFASIETETKPTTEPTPIDPSMYNRVRFRVGDVATVCRWGLTKEEREQGNTLMGDVVVVDDSLTGACEWIEPHQHVMVRKRDRLQPFCGGILAPLQRVLEEGDLVRIQGHGDVPVVRVARFGFAYVLGDGSEHIVPFSALTSAGVVHADGLEIGVPLDFRKTEMP